MQNRHFLSQWLVSESGTYFAELRSRKTFLRNVEEGASKRRYDRSENETLKNNNNGSLTKKPFCARSSRQHTDSLSSSDFMRSRLLFFCF